MDLLLFLPLILMQHVQDLIWQTMSCTFPWVHAFQHQHHLLSCTPHRTISTSLFRNIQQLLLALVLHWLMLPSPPLHKVSPRLAPVEVLVLSFDKLVPHRLVPLLLPGFPVTISREPLPCWLVQSRPHRTFLILIHVLFYLISQFFLPFFIISQFFSSFFYHIYRAWIGGTIAGTTTCSPLSSFQGGVGTTATQTSQNVYTLLQSMNNNAMCTYQPLCTAQTAATLPYGTIFNTATTTSTTAAFVYTQTCSIGGYPSQYSSTTAVSLSNVPTAVITTPTGGATVTGVVPTTTTGGSASTTQVTGNVIVQQYLVRDDRILSCLTVNFLVCITTFHYYYFWSNFFLSIIPF